MWYPIFTAKPSTKANITAHGLLQPAQALLCTKPKPKDKRPSPPALLRFVRPPWRHLGARALWRYQGARPLRTATASLDPPTITHCRRYTWPPTFSCWATGARRVVQDHLRTFNTWFMIRSRLPWIFLAPTIVTGRSYATPHPFISASMGPGATTA
jgi:hypothetical protein